VSADHLPDAGKMVSRRTTKGLRLARTTQEIEIMSDTSKPTAGASSKHRLVRRGSWNCNHK